jgi:hypothetical protein
MMSAPLALTSSGRIALTVAAVPTGMKAGVRISPRSMAITPVRAAPSTAAMENENLVTQPPLSDSVTRCNFAKKSGY